MKPSRCKSCGAEVVFASNVKSGKMQILDARPITVWRIRTDSPEFQGYEVSPYTEAVKGHVDHHATCPKAAEWKKKPG